MAKKTFDLGDTLADVLGKVSESDRPVEQIVLIPLPLIDADEKNFYSLDGIEELAANIELVGLLDPLRVRENPNMPGRFLIVSGHRRAAALRLLAEESPEKWDRVPCIVERPGASPQLEELRLIMANADTRKMSSADLAKQAERVQTLLYELKEQGVIKFSGRMRDAVAEACKVSATKLAELKVIREKLTNPEIRWYWDNGKLNQAQAYAIVKAEPYVQAALCTYVGAENLPKSAEWAIRSSIRKITAVCERKCEHGGPLSEHCKNCDVMLERLFRNPNAYSACEFHCCGDCPEMTKCKTVCEFYREEAEKRKTEVKAARKQEIQAEKDREAQLIGVTKKIWTRFGELRRAKGMSAKEITEARGDQFYASYHGEEWQEQMEGPDAKITEHTSVPWTNSMQADDVEKLVKTADAFGVSCDYLLGRTDERRPWGSEWTSVEDHYPEEGTYVWAVDKFGTVLPSVYFRAAFMDFRPKSVANERLKHIEWWMAMPAPPPGMKYSGQEIIQEITEGRK